MWRWPFENWDWEGGEKAVMWEKMRIYMMNRDQRAQLRKIKVSRDEGLPNRRREGRDAVIRAKPGKRVLSRSSPECNFHGCFKTAFK